MKLLLILLSLVYCRADWRHWTDEDGDCQDTRAEMLIRDNRGRLEFRSPRRCHVLKGRWKCPYTGRVLTLASDVDVDHVIPLKWAYDHGGADWSPEKKRRFANDPLNLLVVDDEINKIKGSRGINSWKPPKSRNKYRKLWRKIKKKYLLDRL
jgi:hypothetical protein